MEAFNLIDRSWVAPERSGSNLERVPGLEGTLSAPEGSAEDFGHMVKRQPSAILHPRSADDVARVIRFARRHRLQVAPRGQGHTLYGQSQVEGGIAVDLRTLSTIHSIEGDRVDVDAGVLWSALLARTLPLGRTPPVLTDLLELTVGGTLSVGGLSGASFRHGVQVDNVLELQVMTGEGERVTCSLARHRDLFEAALAGLGQCGVIVRATLRLVPAPTHVRLYELGYADLKTMLRDQLRATEDERFDYVVGFALPALDGGWTYKLQVLVYHTPPTLPDDARRLEGLSHSRVEAVIDMPYHQWVSRLEPQMAELRRLGLHTRAHPWSDLFVPASRIEAFAGAALEDLSPAEVDHYFPVLFYVLKRDRLTRPLFRVPDEPTCFLFGVLRTATPATRGVAAMLADNRALYERNRQWGGTHYPHAALELSPADWRARYGSAWEGFAAAKRRYDPDNVLTPGPGIFPAVWTD